MYIHTYDLLNKGPIAYPASSKGSGLSAVGGALACVTPELHHMTIESPLSPSFFSLSESRHSSLNSIAPIRSQHILLLFSVTNRRACTHLNKGEVEPRFHSPILCAGLSSG
jgi:hypothetical protein